MKPIVGQMLYYVPDRIHNAMGQDVRVTRVVHTWADVRVPIAEVSLRVNLESGFAFDADRKSVGRCYLSQSEYLARRAADKAWRDLSSELNRLTVPRNVYAPDIITAAALLGIFL